MAASYLLWYKTVSVGTRSLKGRTFTLETFSFALVCFLVFFLFYIQVDWKSILQKGGVHFVGLDLRLSCGRAATNTSFRILQKGGVPAAPSGTATLLRLSPNHQFHLRPPLAVTDFRCPRLSWLDGRCVQGPGTYSPRHG